MKIALLHTAEVHVARFTAAFAERDPACRLDHVVRPDLLDRARAEGLGAVAEDFRAAIAPLLQADAVLCTCSTLGPLLDDLHLPHAIRIDRPMMQAACLHGPRIGVALCLESTRDATLALLEETARSKGAAIAPTVISCTDAWAAFEAGDLDRYQDMIAAEVRNAMQMNRFDCIVLAQASMADTAEKLADAGVPILTPPGAAVEATLDAARNRI